MTFIVLFIPSLLLSQERVAPLHQWAAAGYQLSFPAWDNTAFISLHSTRTYLRSDLYYQTNMVAGSYPFVRSRTGRRLGDIAIHVLQKNTGESDLLKSTHAGLSLAYQMPIDQHHFINFGLQGVFNQVKTSLERFTTGNQWIANEFRFDPTVHIGESILENQVRYPGVNAGLSWQWKPDPSGASRVFADVTVFNLNSPNASFFQRRNELRKSMLIHFGSNLYRDRRYEISADIFYKYIQTSRVLYSQIHAKIHFSNENPYDIIRSGSVELAFQYDFQNALMTGIALHQAGFSVAFGYNFGLSVTAGEPAFRNGTELAVRINKTIWKKKPAVIAIKGTAIGTKRTIDFGRRSPDEKLADTNAAHTSDVEVIQKNISELSTVSSVRFELDKDFNYAFGKSELSAEARLYLDELGSLLRKNPDYRLEVIGHTDNVGRPSVNYKLSATRAKIVANYLIQNGLAPERIASAGRGDTEPVATNDTEENRAKNRRVHFIIYVNR